MLTFAKIVGFVLMVGSRPPYPGHTNAIIVSPTALLGPACGELAGCEAAGLVWARQGAEG